MTQRFFHTLTNFVVIFTTLFLVFGPLLSNVAQAQLTPDTYADFEPPTEGYESIFDTVGGDDLLFSMPVGDTTGPSEESKKFFEGTEDRKKESETTTEPGNSVSVVQAINLAENKNFETIYNFLVMSGGWVASLGGMLFDFAFKRLVLEFGCWFVADATGCSGGAGQVGGAVNQLWTVVRDLFNLVFIFSLVYIGLRLIVDANETATQKTIGLLIAAALLVNFSLYIGKLVIDVSNFTAVQIHDAMVKGFTYADDGGYSVKDEVTTKDGPKTVTLIGSTGKESISGAFMQVLYISTFFSSKSLVTDGPGALLVGVVAFIFLCYLGFVLAYGAIMVVVRFIALVFLLIFSPAMFLGWVLPQFETYSRQWRTNFISYCFFIPAYVFLLYTSLFVLIQVSAVFKSNADYGAVFSKGATSDTWSIFLLYFLGVGFLYASTKVAGAMAKSGSKLSLNGVSKIAGSVAGGATFGASAWAGRKTLGRFGYKLSENDTLRDNAAKGGIKGFAARRALDATRFAGNASYDVRGIKPVGKNLEAGKAKKGGYATSLKESAKKSAAYAKDLGYDSSETKQIEDQYKLDIGEAELNLTNIQNKLADDDQIKASRDQIGILQNQMNAPNVTNAQKEKLTKEILAQQTAIKSRQEYYGVDAAKEKISTLKKEQEAKVKNVKARRAENYAKMLETSKIMFGNDILQFHHQNQSDAAAIRKELNKNKNDELLEKLGNIEKQAEGGSKDDKKEE